MELTVFRLVIWFDDDIDENTQYRYVVAKTEEEAIEKLEKHAKEMESQGYAKMHISCWDIQVELDDVIV